MRPGVGREGGEAFDGFDVGGVVVAHDCAGTGEEAVGGGGQWVGLGGGLVRRGYLRKVGGVLVDVFGQEVLHGCRVEHDGAGSFDAGMWMERVVDGAEGAGLRGFGEMEVEDLDAGYMGFFLLDPRALDWI